MKHNSEIVAIWKSVNTHIYTSFSYKTSQTRKGLTTAEYHVYENVEKSVRNVVKQFINNTDKHLKNYVFRK